MSMGWAKLVLAAVVALGAGLAAAAELPRDPQTYFFDQTLGDFKEELATAKAQHKNAIFLFFEMADCPFCHRMKTTILNQPAVQAYYRAHFLNFSVDTEGDVDITDFRGETMPSKDFAFKENGVRATPVLAFFDLSGKRVVRYTGATRDAEEFLLLGRYVVDGVYQRMPFTKYKREQRAAEGG